MRKGFVTGILLLVLALWAAQEKTPPPADEKGEALVQKLCVGCHDADTVTASRRTEIGWKETIDDMVSRGAEGSPDELAEIARYLTRHFGKLNINTASVRQMQDFLGLTEKESQTIRDWRDQNGKLQTFDQLLAVPGLDAARLKEKRGLIAFSQ